LCNIKWEGFQEVIQGIYFDLAELAMIFMFDQCDNLCGEFDGMEFENGGYDGTETFLVLLLKVGDYSFTFLDGERECGGIVFDGTYFADFLKRFFG